MPKHTRDPTARTENVNVRVSPGEKEALKVRATEEGKTVAELVRPSIVAIAARGNPSDYPWPIGAALHDLAEKGAVTVDAVEKAHDLAHELERMGRDFEIERLGEHIVVRVVS